MGCKHDEDHRYGSWREEDWLPLTWVRYDRDHFGIWVRFSEMHRGDEHLCSCMRPAVRAWLESDARKSYRLARGDANLLHHFVGKTPHHAETVEEVLDSAVFRDGLCHLCAGGVPARPAGGGRLIDRHFHWYLEQAELELGLKHEYVRDALRRDPSVYALITERLGLGSSGQFTREDLLYLCVTAAFSKMRVERRVRPAKLDGLELDIWLPDLWLGLEYQGVQHERPVDYFGGEVGHAALKERDGRKRERLKELGVYLEDFTERDELSVRKVRERLLRYSGRPELRKPPGKCWYRSSAMQPGAEEWEMLSEKQREDVVRQLQVLEKMDEFVKKQGMTRTKAGIKVAEWAKERWKAPGRASGFSPVTIRNKYREWCALGEGRTWQDLIRFRSLMKDKSAALRNIGLSEKAVKQFFKAYEGGLHKWAEENGLNPAVVGSKVDGRSVFDAELANALKRAIADERSRLKKEVRRLSVELRKAEHRLGLIDGPL